MSKRILSALLAVLFLITGLPSTVWAVGEGNMEAGGGQTETVTGDSFWNGQWGIRFRSVYKELHADHETGAADNKTG